MLDLIHLITSLDPAVRNQSLDKLCHSLTAGQLLQQCSLLDDFRRRSDNLYDRVRALFFLYAIYRFHLPTRAGIGQRGLVPFQGYEHLLHRRFEEAIDHFLHVQQSESPSDAICSALATAYHRLAFQTLADQVRRSVRSVRGNQWMFRMGHPADQPLRLRPELLEKSSDGTYPILSERTPVRMDLTHSAWSDIFFLGMDFPEGAKVLNVSIDLGVHGRDASPAPPVEAYLRVIEEPVLRLTSVDLGATADIKHLSDVFDFAKDYLGLLKAAVIASGIVPPGIEGSGQDLAELLSRIVGPGLGLEIVSSVNNIPKGSRLAVSTNLLAALISVCMRATRQAASLTGQLQEHERRLVLARAILGEWLGGSGGGWQDSGGVWPGIKLIQGVLASDGDPEWGISRGRLMPQHSVFGRERIPESARQHLQESLVLVHGGMAQNVGPILEMVTEKYLLRSEAEWNGRLQALGLLDEVMGGLEQGNIRTVGEVTSRNFQGPIQTIIPWASTYYTEKLIQKARAEFGQDFWGFWMLGGMSGGGMGFIFSPTKKRLAQERMQAIMSATKRELQHALPFAMDPVVYDFAINENGTLAGLLKGPAALMPQSYYAQVIPQLLRCDARTLPQLRRAELDKFGAACRTRPELRGMIQTLFDAMLPRDKDESVGQKSLGRLLDENGFDRAQHDQIRIDLKDGRIGLAQNRLPSSAVIEDVKEGDVLQVPETKGTINAGLKALQQGQVAVISLAAGAGSRWTQGAGVVKALHPFSKLAGHHRTFIETHLAKSRRISKQAGTPLPHIFTTSYLTHGPIAEFLANQTNYGYDGPLYLSPGKSVGLRLVPTVRDLRFAWEEMPQQMLDEQQQKVRDSLRTALLSWARSSGEATDYTNNLPVQCLHPVGHWYEVPNLFRNGVLRQLLQERPNLNYLLLHNIDTLGADVDPNVLGTFIQTQACLAFEMITRRIDDRGGGLARVNGQVRLVEGLAIPREEEEFKLSYYNSMTTWIDLDKLLAVFGLAREDILAAHDVKITTAIRTLAAKMPTYVTLKDVKKRWGHGQEDIFPVTQFEKLWGDMTALPEIDSRFLVVSRLRGQQLKDQAQLDGWLRDGSAAYVETLCDWDPTSG
ncbi:MAG: UTP--glucose-phosphate uridylyltransferase-like protein [Verrucomicrobiales bacterium]|nr:UTP--glucose-phosphate uridylyltransferase-like protein [Verrucomicrobiales bacterium]